MKKKRMTKNDLKFRLFNGEKTPPTELLGEPGSYEEHGAKIFWKLEVYIWGHLCSGDGAVDGVKYDIKEAEECCKAHPNAYPGDTLEDKVMCYFIDGVYPTPDKEEYLLRPVLPNPPPELSKKDCEWAINIFHDIFSAS